MSIKEINTFINTPLPVASQAATCPFHRLPNDLLWRIFSELPKDIHALALTSRHFCEFIANYTPLLDSIFRQRFPDSYKNFQSDDKCSSAAKEVYKKCTTISNNIKANQYRIQTLDSHTNVNLYFQIHEGCFYSFLPFHRDDNIFIELSDFKSGEKLRTFSCDARTPIRTFQAHRGCLYAGLNDGTIAIWDLKNDKKPPQTLSGHGNPVVRLNIDETCLCSASNDDIIKIWDLENGKELHTFPGYGHDSAIFPSFQIHNGKCYIGSPDNSITIWDVKNGEKFGKLYGHGSMTSSLLIHKEENRLYVGSYDGQITIWDLTSFKQLGRLSSHTNFVNKLHIHDGYLYSTSWDKTINIWDLESGQLLQTLIESEDGYPTCSQIYKGHFYLISRDKGTLKLLDFSSPSL
jgi:WD40 repeat protein